MASKKRLTPPSTTNRTDHDEESRVIIPAREGHRIAPGPDGHRYVAEPPIESDLDGIRFDHLFVPRCEMPETGDLAVGIYARWIDTESGVTFVRERRVCGRDGEIVTPLAIVDATDDVVAFCSIESDPGCVGLVRAARGTQTVKMLRSFLGIYIGRNQAPLWMQRWRIVPVTGADAYIRWTRRPTDAVFIDPRNAKRLRQLSETIRSRISDRDPFDGSATVVKISANT